MPPTVLPVTSRDGVTPWIVGCGAGQDEANRAGRRPCCGNNPAAMCARTLLYHVGHPKMASYEILIRRTLPRGDLVAWGGAGRHAGPGQCQRQCQPRRRLPATADPPGSDLSAGRRHRYPGAGDRHGTGAQPRAGRGGGQPARRQRQYRRGAGSKEPGGWLYPAGSQQQLRHQSRRIPQAALRARQGLQRGHRVCVGAVRDRRA